MKNRVPKFHAKHLNWLMPLILSGIMSGAISCFNMLLNKGWSDQFISLWLHNWMISWAFAFPIVLLLLPFVRKLTGLLVDMSGSQLPK